MSDVVHLIGSVRSTKTLASTWTTLCRLPATGAWVWLVRSGAIEAAEPVRAVLLNVLPNLWASSAQRCSGVVELTKLERAAIQAAMNPVAGILEEIGWTTRLADLTEPQALLLIETAIDGFQEAMAAIAKHRQDCSS